MLDLSKIAFDSRLNYMKRSEVCGVTTGTYGGALSSTEVTINHELGYSPFMAVGVDLFDDGVIWSNEYVWEYTQSASSGIDNPANFRYWTTDNSIVIQLINGDGSGTESGDVNIYYITYLDYGS